MIKGWSRSCFLCKWAQGDFPKVCKCPEAETRNQPINIELSCKWWNEEIDGLTVLKENINETE